MSTAAAFASAGFNDRFIYADPAGCSTGGKVGVQVATFDPGGTSVDDTDLFVIIP